MAAGRHDFTVRQGETFTRAITYKNPDGTPVNLSGYTARMAVRKREGQGVLASPSITLGGASGTITPVIAASVTAAMPPGEHEYDLFVVSGGGVAACLLFGRFVVERAVSPA